MYFLLSAVFIVQFLTGQQGFSLVKRSLLTAAIERQPMPTKTAADSDELHPCCCSVSGDRRAHAKRGTCLFPNFGSAQYFLFSSYRLWSAAGCIRRVRCSCSCLMKSSGWRALHLQLYGTVTNWRFRVCLLAPVGMGVGTNRTTNINKPGILYVNMDFGFCRDPKQTLKILITMMMTVIAIKLYTYLR